MAGDSGNGYNFRYHFHQRVKTLPSLIQSHLLDIFVVSWLLLLWVLSSLGDMPSGTDTPIHYFKVSQTREFLTKGAWPNWSFQTQGGAPFLSTYPPLYYVLVTILSLLFLNIGFSMKILALLMLIGLFLSFSLLSRLFSGYRNQAAVAIFCLAISVMYSMVGQQSFVLAVLFSILSICCFLIAIPGFKCPAKQDNSIQRAIFLLILSPLFFCLTILTHLVAAYMLGVFWLIVIMYRLTGAYKNRTMLIEAIPPFYTACVGVLLSAIWFFPALLEYAYQNQFKVTILQQIFWNDDLMIIVALVGVSPLLIVLLSSLTDKYNDQERILIVTTIIFFLIGIGKYSPFQLIPAFKSLLPGRVLVFVMITGSLLAKSNKKTTRVAMFLLFIISSATLVYYINPSILGIVGAETRNWRNSGLELMAQEGSLFGEIPDDFQKALDSLKLENDSNRVIYISYFPSLSPLMQHYRLLYLSGHGTVQGDYPDSSEDIKWMEYTGIVDNPYYYYEWPNITEYLSVGNVGWLIYKPVEGHNFPQKLDSYFSVYTVHGDYELWKSVSKPSEIFGINGSINATLSRDSINCKILIEIASSDCTSVMISETYHPRWVARDQDNNVLAVTRNAYGFIDIEIGDSQGIFTLELKPVNGILPSAIITVITIVILPVIVYLTDKLKFKKIDRGNVELQE